MGDLIDSKVADDLTEIFTAINETGNGSFILSFEPTLVRGMGYYTGTIFEIEMEGFGGAVAGGGRDDGMIGRFMGQDVPACGFSIGFERIITILMDNGYKVPDSEGKTAFLIEKGVDAARLCDIMKQAAGNNCIISYPHG